MKIQEQFEIKGSLVIDRQDGYSYNLTSKIDADHLYSRLKSQQDKINTLEKVTKQSQEIDKKLDKISKQLIQLQLTHGIMSEELTKLQEMIP